MRVTLDGYNFDNTFEWIKQSLNATPTTALNQLGKDGVSRLRATTPIGETGQTANGWNYRITKNSDGYELSWFNIAHPETSIPLVILLEYGHGTGTGGYVPGRHFIKRSMEDVFNKASNTIGKEMIK